MADDVAHAEASDLPYEHRYTRVRFDGADDIRVRVAFNLYVSVFALLCDEFRQRPRDAVRSPVTELVRSLPAPVCAAVAPIVAPGRSLCPDCLSPGDPTKDTDFGQEIERLRCLTAEELRDDLERTFAGSRMPDHWQPVWERPRRWAHNFAFAAERVGATLQPAWQRSAEPRQREAERIGVAVARGMPDVVLGSAHPRGRIAGAVLELPDAEPAELDRTGRQLALTPMIGRPRTVPCNLDWPTTTWFGYPLPLSTSGAVFRPNELDALLTPIRAQLLRVLDREHTMGELSQALTCSAATATHHCDQLVKAGLLHRDRDGKTVLVSRTRRAQQLLEAYSTPAEPS